MILWKASILPSRSHWLPQLAVICMHDAQAPNMNPAGAPTGGERVLSIRELLAEMPPDLVFEDEDDN